MRPATVAVTAYAEPPDIAAGGRPTGMSKSDCYFNGIGVRTFVLYGAPVTALHNHFFFDEPNVYFMHVSGMGDAGTLAAAVKKVYDKVAEIRATQPEPQKTFAGAKIGATNSITRTPGSNTWEGASQGRHVQGRHWPHGDDARHTGCKGDGHQHVGGLRGQQ